MKVQQNAAQCDGLRTAVGITTKNAVKNDIRIFQQYRVAAIRQSPWFGRKLVPPAVPRFCASESTFLACRALVGMCSRASLQVSKHLVVWYLRKYANTRRVVIYLRTRTSAATAGHKSGPWWYHTCVETRAEIEALDLDSSGLISLHHPTTVFFSLERL